MTPLKRPNVREIMVPDDGYLMVEVDVKGADARVVAWEANDSKLKKAFRDNIDLHTENAQTLWPGRPITYELRQKAKVGVHAVNYGCRERTLASHLEITMGEAQRFIDRWFTEHPDIRRWHHNVGNELLHNRCAKNAYGYVRRYFDRPEGLLPEALAWIGQSTTAIATNKMIARLRAEIREVQMLLQTHDSCTFQVKIDRFPILLPRIKEVCTLIVPYKDPLVMSIDIKVSDQSWGLVEKIPEETAHA